MGNGSENEGLTYLMLGEQIELSDKGNGKEEHGGCGVCVHVRVWYGGEKINERGRRTAARGINKATTE